MDQTLLKLLLAGIILIIAFKYVCQRNKGYDYERYAPYDITSQHTTPPPAAKGISQDRMNTPTHMNHQPISVSSDLLPKPPQTDNDFGEFAPKRLTSMSFLDATRYIGLDSVGSSLKNPNYQIRADPPIPRASVGPWQQSTIEADLLRKSLDC